MFARAEVCARSAKKDELISSGEVMITNKYR